MLSFAPRVRVFIAPDPIDLHLSFDRLAGIVRHQLRRDPLSGELFAFFNRTRTKIKLLFFDGSGFAIFYKRLEKGSFQLPAIPPGASRVEVDPATLAMILEGIDLRAPRRLRFRLESRSEPVLQS
jgi:transposase